MIIFGRSVVSYEVQEKTVNDDDLFDDLDEPVLDCNFGCWEKWEKGIASKLLLKHGYKQGTGLGSTNSGISVPITIENQQTHTCGLGHVENGSGHNAEKRRRDDDPEEEESNVFDFMNKTLNKKIRISTDITKIEDSSLNEVYMQKKLLLEKMETKSQKLKLSVNRNQEKYPVAALAMIKKAKSAESELNFLKNEVRQLETKIDLKKVKNSKSAYF